MYLSILFVPCSDALGPVCPSAALGFQLRRQKEKNVMPGQLEDIKSSFLNVEHNRGVTGRMREIKVGKPETV